MTRIWAHRGASRAAPENTVPAFTAAAALGADGVELDVQRTRDGRLVAFSVQYHPEAAAGPHDASYLFDEFVAMMADNARTTTAGEQA